MYSWGCVNRAVAAAVEDLPPEAWYALLALMSAACLNPPEPAAGSGDSLGWPMPTMSFGPNAEGIVSFLIAEADKELLITQVLWVG